MNTVYKGVNCETRTFLEYWEFGAKDFNEVCDFLDWLAWDTYEFETSCFILSPHPLSSVIMLLLCVKFVIVLIMTVILVVV